MNGQAHAVGSVIVAVTTSTLALIIGPEFYDHQDTTSLALALFSGGILGIPLSPDLDHHAKTYSEHWVSKKLGRNFGYWYTFYWMPYSILIPHRSFWSHGIIVGTLGRLFYISLPLIVLSLLWPGFFTWFPWEALYSECAMWVYLSLLLSDVLHRIMDSRTLKNLLSPWYIDPIYVWCYGRRKRRPRKS